MRPPEVLNEVVPASWRKALLWLTGGLCGLALLFWPARPLRSDSFVFYFPNSKRVIPLEVIENTKYLPFLQVLNLVGTLSSLSEKRNNIKVGFGKDHIELHADDARVRLDKKVILLAAPVRVSNGKWMVPSDFVTVVLPKLTDQDVEYQVGTNRVFLGNVKPGSFTVRLEPESNGARLTFQFTDKVTLRTESSNGQWVMFLGDHPVQPLEQSFHFQNPYVAAVRFDDQDGLPKLLITPSSPGLNFYPLLTEGDKVLRAEVSKPAPPPPQTPATSAPAPTTAGAPPAPAQTPAAAQAGAAAPPSPPLPVVALDAGHGGDDTGAKSRDGVLEKNLVATLVGRVRQSLLATAKFRVVLTRTGDANTTFEQRAVAANTAGAAYFLTFHAGDLGGASPRVAVYTFQSPAQETATLAGETRLVFVPWSQIQEAYLDQSRQLARTLQQDFAVIAGVTADLPTSAPVRTLRSVNAPAVAIEVGSLSPDDDATSLSDTAFQVQFAAVVAEALSALQGGGG